MNVLVLLVILIATAGWLHVTRFWPRVALVGIVAGVGLMLIILVAPGSSSLDVLGVTLGLDASPRDLMLVSIALTGALAIASLMPKDRTSLGFLFWPWTAWLAALAVSDYVVSLFAWALGMIALVLAMKPRKYRRASGAAYFLVLVVVATASLLLADRFVALYPLTPERTGLIQLAELGIAWGMGLLLAVFPFHLWAGPMADDAPLPITALLLGLGQPIGIWVLMRFLSQYPWLVDKSNLLDLFVLGGTAAVITGGVLAGVERRAGRLIAYGAMFAFGFTLIDLGRATREGLGYAGFELLSRALCLVLMACAMTIARNVENRRVQQLSLAAFILAGLSLVGLRLGVSFAGRWNLLADWAGATPIVLALVVFAHTGIIVGLIRFARRWLAADEIEPQVQAIPAVRRETSLPAVMTEHEPALVLAGEKEGGARDLSPGGAPQAEPQGKGNGSAPAPETAEGPGEEYVFEEHVRELARTIGRRYGPRMRGVALAVPRQTGGTILWIWRSWRVWSSVALLVALTIALLVVSAFPGIFVDRLLATIGGLPFVQ